MIVKISKIIHEVRTLLWTFLGRVRDAGSGSEGREGEWVDISNRLRANEYDLNFGKWSELQKASSFWGPFYPTPTNPY